jgi:hypothetical protein
VTLLALLQLGSWLAPHALAQSCTQPPPGLVAWWPGDGSFVDIQGDNDGTNAGGTTFAVGEVGQGFSFDASSESYIILPNSPSLSPTTQVTIEAWIKPDFSFTAGADIIMNKRDVCGSNRSYILSVTHQEYGSSQGTLPARTIVWSTSIANDDVYPTTLFPDDGQFHHLAGTYDGSSMNVYLDGQLIGAKTHSGTIPTTIDPPSIGLQVGCGDVGTHAVIDEVKLYGRALAQIELQAIVNSGQAGQCKIPLAAVIQQPINADGSSVFNASKGVIPVKFVLTKEGQPTCELPPATISVDRLSGNPGPIDESVYTMPSDSGSNFRVAGCQYVYNLGAKSFGPGEYLVNALINGISVGSGRFALK